MALKVNLMNLAVVMVFKHDFFCYQLERQTKESACGNMQILLFDMDGFITQRTD